MKTWNKKAEKYLSMYWFAILIIVAVGISLIVLIFYGKPFDVRNAESEILINKIADCISVDNELNLEITNENFLGKCNLVIDENYYIEIENLGIKKGNFNLKDYCSLPKPSVSCVKRGIYLSKQEQTGWVDIFVIIDKTDKNA